MAKKKKETPVKVKETTWEFKQDGATWRKTYNEKGDVIKTEKL
jgi:hypothetical protein